MHVAHRHGRGHKGFPVFAWQATGYSSTYEGFILHKPKHGNGHSKAGTEWAVQCKFRDTKSSCSPMHPLCTSTCEGLLSKV